MVVDAGFLVSVDRGERAAHAFVAAAAATATELHTTEPVVAQVWRDGARQARFASFLTAIVIHPFDDGRAVGRLLARSTTADVVDAHLALTAARLGDDIITGDVDDLTRLVHALGPLAPTVHSWP